MEWVVGERACVQEREREEERTRERERGCVIENERERKKFIRGGGRVFENLQFQITNSSSRRIFVF